LGLLTILSFVLAFISKEYGILAAIFAFILMTLIAISKQNKRTAKKGVQMSGSNDISDMILDIVKAAAIAIIGFIIIRALLQAAV